MSARTVQKGLRANDKIDSSGNIDPAAFAICYTIFPGFLKMDIGFYNHS